MKLLTQWKKEAIAEWERKFPITTAGSIQFFLENLIDRIHAHTLEEVRGKLTELLEKENAKASTYGELDIIGRMIDFRNELELLEHPTD